MANEKIVERPTETIDPKGLSRPEDVKPIKMPGGMPDLWVDPKQFSNEEEKKRFILREYRRYREDAMASDDLRIEQQKAVGSLERIVAKDGQKKGVPEISASSFMEQLKSNTLFDHTNLGRSDATKIRQAFQADPESRGDKLETVEYNYGHPLSPLAHAKRFRSLQGTDGSVDLKRKQFEDINPDSTTKVVIDPVSGDPIIVAYDPRSEAYHPIDFGQLNLFDITDLFSDLATIGTAVEGTLDLAAAYSAPGIQGSRAAQKIARMIERIAKVTGGPSHPNLTQKLLDMASKGGRTAVTTTGAATSAAIGVQADDLYRHLRGKRDYSFDESMERSKTAAKWAGGVDASFRPIAAFVGSRFDKTRHMTVPDVESTLGALVIAEQLNLPPLVWSDLTPLGKMRLVQSFQRTITGRHFADDRVHQIFNRLHKTFVELGDPTLITADTLDTTVDFYMRELAKEFKMDKTMLSSSGQGIQEGVITLGHLMTQKFKLGYEPFDTLFRNSTWSLKEAKRLSSPLSKPHKQPKDLSGLTPEEIAEKIEADDLWIDTKGGLYSRADVKRFLDELNAMDPIVTTNQSSTGLQRMRDLRTRARELMDDSTLNPQVQRDISKIHNALSKSINNPSGLGNATPEDIKAFNLLNTEYADYIKLQKDIEFHRLAQAVRPEQLGEMISGNNLTQIKKLRRAYNMQGKKEGAESFEKVRDGWKTNVLNWSPSRMERELLSKDPADQEFIRLMVPSAKERESMLGYARSIRRFNTSTVMNMARRDFDTFTGIADLMQEGTPRDLQRILIANQGVSKTAKGSPTAQSLRSGLFIHILGSSSVQMGKKVGIVSDRAVKMLKGLEARGVLDELFWRDAKTGKLQLNEPVPGGVPILLENLQAYLDILAPIGQSGASIGSAALAEATKVGNLVATPSRYFAGKKTQVSSYLTSQVLIRDPVGRIVGITNRHGTPGWIIQPSSADRGSTLVPQMGPATWFRVMADLIASAHAVQTVEERNNLDPAILAQKREIDMEKETRPEDYIDLLFMEEPTGEQMFQPSLHGDQGNVPPRMDLDRRQGISDSEMPEGLKKLMLKR